MRLQILATEHWSLLASRSLAWTESFSRASMFLTTLTGAVVALGLVAQGSGFGRTFAVFAIVILPVVVFLGVTTFLRLGTSNYHDHQCAVGMNRIRAAYLRMAPDLKPYFVMSAHDDARGVFVTQAAIPQRKFLLSIISATPWTVGVLTGVVAGVIGSVIGYLAGFNTFGIALAGAVAAIVTIASLARSAAINIRRIYRAQEVLFPTPEP